MIHSRGRDYKTPLCGSRQRIPTVVSPLVLELRKIIDCEDCLEVLEGKVKRRV